MADYLTHKSRECMRTTFGGVMIECYPDGTVQVFADPERFSVMLKAGRGEGRDTGRMNSCVVIAPIFAPQTGIVSAVVAPSNPLAPIAPHAPTILNPQDHRLKGPE